MIERVTFDTNVLVYALDPRNPFKQEIAEDLVRRGPGMAATLTTVVLGEFFHAATRKFYLTPEQAARRVDNLIGIFPIIATMSVT